MSAVLELALASSGAPAYAGPLDLLLAIVRRNGYPLDRLPLGEITRQFTAYVQQATAQTSEQDLELGAEFFETISWLVLLKSRALLPEHTGDREPAPAEELRRALVAQEQVRELQGLLGERLEQAGLNASGPALQCGPTAASVSPAATESSLFDHPPTAPTVHDALISARRALAAARLHADAQAAAEAGVSVEEVLAILKARMAALAPGETLSTRAWFGADREAEVQSALVLALLELARLGQIWIYQPAPGAPLWVQRPAPAHASPRKQPGRRAAPRKASAGGPS